jgi:pimeloyl-ACP methyl ester carboxylesterase
MLEKTKAWLSILLGAASPRLLPHRRGGLAECNGVRIAYETFGLGGAPPLLLIAGFAQQMIAWEEAFCARLAARGFRVVRFDNRDVGLSSRIDPPPALPLLGALRLAPYTLRDMARDAVGLLDALDMASAHVVGISMGGMIAQEMAIHHAERVRSLTLLMTSSGAPDLPGPDADVLRLVLQRPPADREGFVSHCVHVWRLLRGNGFPEDDALDAMRAARIFERGISPAGAARQLAAVAVSGSRREELRRVAAPTLILHGDADRLVPLAAAQDLAQAIPGARLTVMEGVGHALPVALWPAVIDAIASHARGAARPPLAASR